MLYVFYGPDEFRASEALAELRTSLDGEGMLATNTTELTGRGLRPGDLVQHAMAAPFMGDARLVIVDGLLTALGVLERGEEWRATDGVAAVVASRWQLAQDHRVLRWHQR